MYKIFKKTPFILITGIIFLLLAFFILGFGISVIKPADKTGGEQTIIVSEGMSLQEVAAKLESKEIIKSRTVFMVWARLMRYSRMIKAGEYRLSPKMAPIRIMEILTKGLIITYPVTLPEGLSLYQIAGILSERGLIDRKQFISIAESGDYIKTLGIKAPSLEGYLYPDTYQFARGLSAGTIIDTMINRFMDVVRPLREQVKASNMKLEEIITLASIVEKETGKAEERPVIASVFLNRLSKKMRLESDPTVIYGIKDFSGNLTRKDLNTPTPYNTYVIRGLPPGPIANPGIESISAVLNPAETDYLYFVSKNDGSHHFSRTLQEHNKAVTIYQKRRR
jgi:UPF0755 protein